MVSQKKFERQVTQPLAVAIDETATEGNSVSLFAGGEPHTDQYAAVLSVEEK
jgi:hypothetical protein